MIGWLSSKAASSFTSHRPLPVGSTRLIEIVFSLLQRKALNGASFKTKDQLRDAIEAFIRRHNERAKPFRWRKREVKGSQLRNTIINFMQLSTNEAPPQTDEVY